MAQSSKIRMRWGNPAYLLALGFGSGLAPKGPGTVASAIAGVVFWLVLAPAPLLGQCVVVVVGFGLGVIAISRVERDGGSHDHGAIVWDEFIGMWITLLAADPHLLEFVAGFALFRAFDIWKPWPVSWADRRVGGGLGVMLDDVLAGILAGTVLLALKAAL